MIVVLVLIAFSATLVFCWGLAVRVRSLENRLQALGHRLDERPLLVRTEGGVHPLQGLRIALNITQDHPQPVFANLLREALLREDALVDQGKAELAVSGQIVGNGYADVYFRADLTLAAGDQALFVVAEKPPHGDRPENLAREVVARLKVELEKRERQSAIRELGN